jgi:glycerol dehydrogenase
MVCEFACQDGSDLHHLPFTVTPAALLDALVALPERSPVPS